MVDRYTSRGVFKNCRGGFMNTPTNNNSNCNACDDNIGSSERSDCRKLRHRLQKIDFAIIDTVLYLDAYPNCTKALNYYHKLIEERKSVVETLSCKCNMPVTSFDNSSADNWSWTGAPWPWEFSAN